MACGGVLFDMDGTLVDSEPTWQASEAGIVASWGGPEWTPALGDSCTGKPLRVTARTMLDHAGHDASESEVVDALLDAMARAYRTDGVTWMPGALDLLDALREAGIPTALVSSSYRCLLDPVIEDAGHDRFTVSIAGDEVAHAKPHPQPYLRAADLLGVDIATCVVVEDSASGLASGRAAGAMLVGITSAAVASWDHVDLEVAGVGDLSVEALMALTRAS